MLEKHNYEIIGEATTGLEAVEKYMELKPDLIIMDIVMLIMDGIYAINKAIATPPVDLNKFTVNLAHDIRDKVYRALLSYIR
ncbi:MAG: response regulator [Herbinix sp.]|jgi:DNA-binding NarL/FixJ family response regulator|nr:response regulator [Herbinix sp.]